MARIAKRQRQRFSKAQRRQRRQHSLPKSSFSSARLRSASVPVGGFFLRLHGSRGGWRWCRGLDGRFTVQIAERTFVIDNDKDLEACLEHIFWHIKHKNEEGLHEAIRGGPARKIGFSAQSAGGGR